MSDLSIMFEARGKATVAVVEGTLTAETADAFQAQFDGWLTRHGGATCVIVDLGLVAVMDSSGLGALLGAWQKVSDREGALRLAALQQRPRLLFDITRADGAFEIYDSVEDAICDED